MSSDKGIFEPKEGFASDKPLANPFEFGDSKQRDPFASPPPPKSSFSPAKSPPPPPSSGSGFDSTPFAEPAPASIEPRGGKASFAVADGRSETRPIGGPPPLGAFAAKPEVQATKPGPPVAPEPTKAAAGTADDDPFDNDPFGDDAEPIRQLELRAIFGVDRELDEDEILERAGKLKGVHELARVSADDVPALDAIKRLVGSLGFDGGAVKLTCGGSPIDFVRRGPVVLAVRTDGGFAPGVRETLLIVARELEKL